MTAIFLRCIAILAGIGPLLAWASELPWLTPAEYSAKPIEAWIVDAETKQPIEGVVVVANWQISAGEGMQAGSKYIQLNILETVTDKTGRFYFPAWGPEPNPTMFGYIEFDDPGLTLFKHGYQFEHLVSIFEKAPRRGALRYSDWDGKTIKLKKASTDPKELVSSFGSLQIYIDPIVANKRACDWAKIPKMLKAIYQEKEWMVQQGIRNGISPIDSVADVLIWNADKYSREGGAACGSPKKLFESN